MAYKKKTAPDAATSKGGNGDNLRSIIPRCADPVKWELEHMHQKPGDPCPRCGDGVITMHMTSRYADVYICQHCKDDEQHELDVGQPHLLLTDWRIVKHGLKKRLEER